MFNKYTNTILSFFILLYMLAPGSYFLGDGSGNYRFSDLITRQEMAIVLHRINADVNPQPVVQQQVQPEGSVTIQAQPELFADDYMAWAEQQNLIVNRFSLRREFDPVTISASEQIVYTMANGIKPYYLPVQAAPYQPGSATRGQVCDMIDSMAGSAR